MPEYFVILVEPKYEGNVGSVARVMKNFDFSELVLVKPGELGKEARKMASHAQDILQNAKIYKSFKEMQKKENFDFLIATSAVTAGDRNPLRTPILPENLKNSLELKGKIGLVFGREDYGLLNEEIKKCDVLVTIPAHKEYPTLNVALSVGILLYEILKLKRKVKRKGKFRKANAIEKKILLEKFNTLVDSVYEHEPKRYLAKKTFKTLLGRAFVSGRESATLTGIFRRAQERVKKSN